MKKSLFAIVFLAGGVCLVSAQTTEKVKNERAAKTEAAANANVAAELKADTVVDAAVLNSDAAVLNSATTATVRDSAVKTKTKADLKPEAAAQKREIEKLEAQ